MYVCCILFFFLVVFSINLLIIIVVCILWRIDLWNKLRKWFISKEIFFRKNNLYFIKYMYLIDIFKAIKIDIFYCYIYFFGCDSL